MVTKLADALFTKSLDTDPVTVALMQPDDADPPLAELCNAEDVSLEGVLQQQSIWLHINMVGVLSKPTL